MKKLGFILLGVVVPASGVLLAQDPALGSATPVITLTKALPDYSSQTLVIHGTDFGSTAA